MNHPSWLHLPYDINSFLVLLLLLSVDTVVILVFV